MLLSTKDTRIDFYKTKNTLHRYTPEKLTARPWKSMVGRWHFLSTWSLFGGQIRSSSGFCLIILSHEKKKHVFFVDVKGFVFDCNLDNWNNESLLYLPGSFNIAKIASLLKDVFPIARLAISEYYRVIFLGEVLQNPPETGKGRKRPYFWRFVCVFFQEKSGTRIYPSSHNHGSVENGTLGRWVASLQGVHFPLNHDCYPPGNKQKSLLMEEKSSSQLPLKGISYIVPWRGRETDCFEKE